MTTRGLLEVKMYVYNEERIKDLREVYKELNIEKQKQMERIAERLLNTQTLIEKEKLSNEHGVQENK
jgi:hypothetical protein